MGFRFLSSGLPVHILRSLMARALAVTIVLVALAAAAVLGVVLRGQGEGARCGAGFVARASRCVVAGTACPVPLAATLRGCNAPDLRVVVPAAAIVVGPSDWEAEGRVAPRTVRVQSFRIDAFEVTRGRWRAGPGETDDADATRAASGMTREEAASFCSAQGGHLPTEDEWVAAAASGSNPPRRYPWGDTGAVCRRAAWGLTSGPCAQGADGPDTVGAHPDGDSPLGLHDMAGNVAEWVAEDAGRADIGIAKGGSWQSTLATDLRIWARLELPRAARDPRVGVRCAYGL